MKIPKSFLQASIIGTFTLMSVLFWAGCEDRYPSPVSYDQPEVTQQATRQLSKANPAIQAVIAVQNRHTPRIMAISGVVGTGVGMDDQGRPVITVFTEEKGVLGIPPFLEDVPTRVTVSGKFVAYGSEDPHWFPRPVPIGVSTGHPDITAGTIGCRVKDGSGNLYALSNNHVFANSNDGGIGDNILQPGPFDGGDEADKIGTLYDFVPIVFDGPDNFVDAAIALVDKVDVSNSTPDDDGYGTPANRILHDEIYVGMPVQKYGRTTGWTHGEVSEISVTVNVCYEVEGFGPFQRCVKSARFIDQIIIVDGDFSDGGDSGSLIVTDDGNNNPVGLLFAGSSSHTVANRIQNVLLQLGDRIGQTLTIDGESDGNTPPTADFSAEPTAIDEGGTVTFTDASSDPDGTVDSWSWNFGDGGTSTEQSPTYRYNTHGVYSVTLTVTDDRNGQNTKTITDYITVNEIPNTPPTADFSAEPTIIDEGGTVTFTDASSDPDGTVDSWSWNFGDGGTSTEQSPTYRYNTHGVYSVTLTVTDDRNGQNTKTITDYITVNEIPNINPTAGFSAEPTTIDEGGTVTFTDASSDPDGTVDSWSWNFGDGGTSTEQSPTYRYNTHGVYSVTLTVTDNELGQSSESKTDYITVNEKSTAGIVLTSSSRKSRDRLIVDLSWLGAATGKVDVYRNGTQIKLTENDGTYTDRIRNAGGDYIYKICEPDGECSNTTTETY